ncbi:MAG: T9SS type A sorting domain-containing protein [Gemmatimonadota bacterium]|nr:MAG: T9SS type A sorting domain-containing protein [Gemmatimonadota bacterium]
MRVKTFIVLTVFVVMSAVCGYAQEAILAIDGEPCADAGATGIEVSITLDNSAIEDDVAGFQFDLNFDKSALTKTDVAKTPRSEDLAIFSTSDTDDGIRVVATGIGQTISDVTGAIAIVTFDVDAGASGDYDLTFVNPKVANPAAQALPLSVVDGVFSVPCGGGGGDEAILAVEDACGDPGQTGVEVNITLDNSALTEDVAGFQFDLYFDKTVLAVSDIVKTDRTEDLTIFSFSETDDGLRLVATGIGTIVSGTTGAIAKAIFDVDAGAAVGEYDLTFVNAKVADPGANPLPVVVVDGTFFVPCDAVELVREDIVPTNFHLTQNYPNPFNPTTSFDLSVPTSEMVNAVIYNVMGQKVRTLVSEELPAGYYTLTWDGLSELGIPVTSGVYFCQVKAGTFGSSIKMLLLK